MGWGSKIGSYAAHAIAEGSKDRGDLLCCLVWELEHKVGRSLSQLELSCLDFGATQSGTFWNPHPWYFVKSITGTNGRRTAVQMGGVLQYNLEVYCCVSLSSRLRRQQGTALAMGGAYGGTNWRCTARRQVVRVGCSYTVPTQYLLHGNE